MAKSREKILKGTLELSYIAMASGKYFSGMAGCGLKGGARLIFENASSHIFYNMLQNK